MTSDKEFKPNQPFVQLPETAATPPLVFYKGKQYNTKVPGVQVTKILHNTSIQ